jgi:LuxR family maltose regulon positive regulatory protein
VTQELSQLGNPVRRRRLAPALRQRVYVPERLRARVTAGLDAGLLQIQAPAGYGKTAVLLQALLDEGIDAQWYTCSSDDADAGHLLRGLVEVLGLAHTVGGQTALAALKTGETRPSYRPLLRPIVEEIGEGDGMHRLLVIDDADVLADAPAALALFDDLVAVLANQVGLVLVSRSELPLGSLAKPRLDGRAARITADDLLLREDEIAECAATAYGIELQGEEIAPLYQATSGWAIALRLALRIRDLSAEFPSRERGLLTPEARADLFAYLAEEVVKRIDASTVEFLRRTAVLETLDPAICARMTGEERPAELIQSLAGAGLPVMKTGWRSTS